jgi:FkbM family methyltransferase
MSYTRKLFTDYILNTDIHTVFELGSRDLLDAHDIQSTYNCDVYAFECNPECIKLCRINLISPRVKLIERAVTIESGPITFHPFDLTKYNNMGSSSLLKIDFSTRDKSDPDYNRENPQTSITVKGVRLDEFCEENGISNVDMLCIDLQGYELNALKSMGKMLSTVKYIILEASLKSTYIGGVDFKDLHWFLGENDFSYVCSTKYNNSFPDIHSENQTYGEFDVLYEKT